MRPPAEGAIRLRTGTVWLEPEGVLVFQHVPVDDVTVDDVAGWLEATRQLAAGARRPILIDGRSARFIPREGRQLIANESADHVNALAGLVGSPLSRVVGNAFLYLTPLPYPTQMYSDLEPALAWLRTWRP